MRKSLLTCKQRSTQFLFTVCMRIVSTRRQALLLKLIDVHKPLHSRTALRLGHIYGNFALRPVVSEIQANFPNCHIGYETCPIWQSSRSCTHNFYPMGAEIELIFALQPAISEIQRKCQNCHIWAYNLVIGKSYRSVHMQSISTPRGSRFLPQGGRNWTCCCSTGQGYQDRAMFQLVIAHLYFVDVGRKLVLSLHPSNWDQAFIYLTGSYSPAAKRIWQQFKYLRLYDLLWYVTQELATIINVAKNKLLNTLVNMHQLHVRNHQLTMNDFTYHIIKYCKFINLCEGFIWQFRKHINLFTTVAPCEIAIWRRKS